MTTSPAASSPVHHHRRRMHGRDPQDRHRVSTPLELLFDLTFVTCFAVAASHFAHALAEEHFASGLIGFGFASFAICWAWINFSWFSSAYDTDDWLFRLVTMVQMVGVLILSIGLPRMFSSLEHGVHLEMSTMVFGYVIMRLSLVSQWLRAARQDPGRRRIALTYAIAISIAQVGWVALTLLHLPLGPSLAATAGLIVLELAGPVIAEGRGGGTPWHAHHIAERYGLFALIALGEGVVGSVAAISAAVGENGWSVEAALVCMAGIGLTFGLWWVYYVMPSAQVLQAQRWRAFVWGYGQIAIIASIVATGAGLHAAAYFIEGRYPIGPLATVLSVAIPVGIFLGAYYALYSYMMACFDRLHLWLLLGTMAVIALAVAAAIGGVEMSICLILLSLAPLVTILGFETVGHRHQADRLAAEGLAED